MVMPFGLWARTGPRNHKLDWVQILHGKGQFWGKETHNGSIGTFCHELCKNSWTDRFTVCIVDSGLVGPRNHKFNRIRQVALVCPMTLCHELCKNRWANRFAVWVVDSGGPKEAHVQSYSPGGANVPSWEDTLAPSGKYSWTVHLLRQCGLMSNYSGHLFYWFWKFVLQTVSLF